MFVPVVGGGGTGVERAAGLTFFGLSGALSEEQLVLFVWERCWEDSGHQRTERQNQEQSRVTSNIS